MDPVSLGSSSGSRRSLCAPAATPGVCTVTCADATSGIREYKPLVPRRQKKELVQVNTAPPSCPSATAAATPSRRCILTARVIIQSLMKLLSDQPHPEAAAMGEVGVHSLTLGLHERYREEISGPPL
ncbi:unnamed protein product [Pleuronectes platessa]|uniref:Uncharacterized protein n=1 Tax=Pleuronectes platessa TaxID=8262 RepID=A0A9N7TMD3_PLEPL|nr:unnamed protein product [Pleuronectes platessa]